MIANSSSVATQAWQVWLSDTLQDLGWKHGTTVLSCYAAPFDTWADMTHLLARESWTGPVQPKSIAYFCGTLKLPASLPPNPIGAGQALVVANASRWQAGELFRLWPLLAKQGSPLPPDKIVSQFFRGNVDPSERYVLSLPGSVEHRLAPDARVYANLYLAGDWTLTRLSSGCVEAAVESGMLASRAICGVPADIAGTER
jgi:uncharacterized protein with NAD-binding domain and iron-sulfur cluster